MSGSQSKSTVSPVVVSVSVTMTPAQFAIDCYNDGNPSGLTGLAYTLYVTLP